MSEPGDRWPSASPGPRADAELRVHTEDFRVSEELVPDGPPQGEHLWLRIRKRGLSTPAVARTLAEAAGVEARDVGYAGLKDERSVAEQWFSVPVKPGQDVCCPGASGIELLEQRLQPRKLRRGMHAGNRFDLVLRNVGVAVAPQGEWLFPNYFGAQRFGRDNIDVASRWLADRRRRRVSPFKRGMYLSVLRSLLFNEVLARRVVEGSWQSLLEGDVADTAGFPTGPLWGRGHSATRGVALIVEQAALHDHAAVREGLEFAGVDQARRSLVGIARDVGARWQAPGVLALSFSLAPGCYATVALGEHFRLRDHAIA